ncbi:hypothetical protein FRC07_004504 [Ceratobasidium sp. 392]|nr:hypothetical protein FRC07_004504 [Ceratobasidium sp. 392]
MDVHCYALDNWKACRSALTAAVQNYLGACTKLHSVCTQSRNLSRTRREIESALLAIDVELSSLASEEEELYKARIALGTARNSSTILTPVRILPPELLARVFLMLKIISPNGYRNKDLPAAHPLTSVSSYWRQIAIETPTLWTYIGVTTSYTSYDYPILSLRRTKGLPIDLYIYHAEDREDRNLHMEWSWAWQQKQSGFFTQASCQTRTLDINSWASSAEPIYSVLKYWLHSNSTDTLKHLCLLDASALHCYPLPIEWDLKLTLTKQSEDILRSLTELEMTFFVIPWGSPIYHGLINLQINVPLDSGVQIATSQFIAILTASPKLAVLKLFGLEVVPSDDWTIVRAVNLETFCLAGFL